MSSKTIRTAVVGVGYLGRFHAQKHKLVDGCQLVGVCDLNEDQGRAVAQEVGCEYFSNEKDLIGKVDAVTIASSTTSHYKLTKYFLENNIHVFVEKPITTTIKEAEEVCKIADERGLTLQVGHVERFNPALRSAQSKLKNVLFIECHRLAPFKPRAIDVGVVLDLMIHDLDVILSLVDSKVKSVSAVGVPVLTKNEDIANARVEFECGTIANITASRVSQNAQRKFRVFQPDSYLSIDFGSGQVNMTTKTGEWVEGNIPLSFESWNLEKEDALLLETKSFIEAIQNKTTPVVSGKDGLNALLLADRIISEIRKRN